MINADKAEIESLVLDQIAKIYNKGVKEGQQHAEPSSKTLLMIEELRSKEISKIKEDLKGISVNICYIKELLKSNNENFVRKEEFEPVKRLVFGIAALMLTKILLDLMIK